MALRMVVNREQEELDALLERAPRMVKPGGRIVMISFMSHEDRKVKASFRELARAGKAVLLTNKPVTPAEQEVRENPPSRSAKLRAIVMAQDAPRAVETAGRRGGVGSGARFAPQGKPRTGKSEDEQ